MTYQSFTLWKDSVSWRRSSGAVPPCRLGLLPCDSLELTAIAICYQGRQRADKHSRCHDMTALPAKWETNRRHAEIWTLTKDLYNASDTTRGTERGLETQWWSRTLLVKTGRNYRGVSSLRSLKFCWCIKDLKQGARGVELPTAWRFSFNQRKSHSVGGFCSWCELIRDVKDQLIQ